MLEEEFQKIAKNYQDFIVKLLDIMNSHYKDSEKIQLITMIIKDYFVK